VKVSLSYNSNNEEDFALYVTSHFCDVIKKELFARFGNYEEVYDYLFKRYNECLAPKNESYGTLPHYKELTVEEEIFSLICDMNRNYPFLLYATINEIAKKKEMYYLSLFIILDHKLELAKDDNGWGSLIIFDKIDIKFIKGLLSEAYDNELLKDHTRLTEHLANSLNGKVAVRENKTKIFLDSINEEIEELDYLTFEDTDEYLNYFNIYKENFEIDYKQIILSKEFHKYVEENDFEEENIEDFNQYIQDYLSESKDINFHAEICKKIISDNVNNVLLNEKSITGLSVGVESVIQEERKS
jgi:hypothetical protein